MAIESPKEECGVFGILNPQEQVAESIYLGLFALQHRGQESAGISTSDHLKISKKAGLGLIANVFDQFQMEDLKGDLGIGHTRYSTTGRDSEENSQPLIVSGINGEISFGHNGNVINSGELKESLEQFDITYSTTSDTEIIAYMYANALGNNWFERSNYCMRSIKGAYSLVFMTKDELIGVRDPLGIRPLCLGKMNDAWILASESSALAHIGAEFVREIENGETIVITKDGVESSIFSSKSKNHKMCIFEQIYFSRPDSIINGQLAYESRVRMGESLAEEHPIDADIVIGVPDSAIPAAIGYANKSGISYTEGLIRNRYVGRTFISPNQRLRELGVRTKFNVLKDVIKDKKIILVDDSIVRGTTTSRVIELLKDSGAAEIHMRVSSPPITSPCYFGVDMASTTELIANNFDNESIRKVIGADSLGFLSMENLLTSVNSEDNDYCRACFTGEYPIPIQLDFDKFHLEKINMSSNFNYKNAGVDLEKSDLIKDQLITKVGSTHNENVLSNSDGFGGLFSTDNLPKDSILVSTTDSVGTKVKISGRIGLHKNLGIDIVNHCINDLIPQGAHPLYFLDYLAFGKLDEKTVLQVVEGISEACKKVNCAIIGGETATLPGVYYENDYDVVGFMVGSVTKSNLKTKDNVKEGYKLVALPSSGLHTNGFSLVRSIFDIDNNVKNLSLSVPNEDKNLGELLAEPHREYLTTIKPFFEDIKAISHVTGGGLYKNLPRVFNSNLQARINKKSWEIPNLFKFIYQKGNIDEKEMFDVFNMGVGLVMIVDSSKSEDILEKCPEAWLLGEIVSKPSNQESVVIE